MSREKIELFKRIKTDGDGISEEVKFGQIQRLIKETRYAKIW